MFDRALSGAVLLAQRLNEILAHDEIDNEERIKIKAQMEELTEVITEFKKTAEDYTKKGFLKKMLDRKRDARSFKKLHTRVKRLFDAIKDFKHDLKWKLMYDTMQQDRDFRMEHEAESAIEDKMRSDGVDETAAGLALQQDPNVLKRVASKGLVSESRFYHEVIEPSSTREWLKQVELAEYEAKIVSDQGYDDLADLVGLSDDDVKQLCGKADMKPGHVHTTKFTRLLASKKHEHAEYTVLLMTEIELVLPAHNETLERRRQVPKTHDGTSHLMEPTAASRARKGGPIDSQP